MKNDEAWSVHPYHRGLGETREDHASLFSVGVHGIGVEGPPDVFLTLSRSHRQLDLNPNVLDLTHSVAG